MAGNRNLHDSAKNKQDEFYTNLTLVEDELKRLGGDYSKVSDWQPYVVTDGLLITGQNPASSGPAAEALLGLVAQRS